MSSARVRGERSSICEADLPTWPHLLPTAVGTSRSDLLPKSAWTPPERQETVLHITRCKPRWFSMWPGRLLLDVDGCLKMDAADMEHQQEYLTISQTRSRVWSRNHNNQIKKESTRWTPVYERCDQLISPFMFRHTFNVHYRTSPALGQLTWMFLIY